MSKRLKHVFTTSEVPHIWARQSQDSGRNQQGNLYFEGPTIYSYGSHFPIATFLDDKTVIITEQTYSNTTSGHVSSVRSAVSHLNRIYAYEPYQTVENYSYWAAELKTLLSEIENPRNRVLRYRYQKCLQIIAAIELYNNHFRDEIPNNLVLLVDKVKSTEIKTLVENEKGSVKHNSLSPEQREENRKKLVSKYLTIYNEYLDHWLNLKDMNHWSDNKKKQLNLILGQGWNFRHKFPELRIEGYTRLRINGDVIETMKGVKIPIPVAQRTFKNLNGCIEGECDKISIECAGYKITRTTKDTVIAGCHTMLKTDILDIAQKLNW